MNTQPKLISNATKAKSLVAAVTIAIGLQGILLWQLDEIAKSGAQRAMLVTSAPAATPPAQALLIPVYQLTQARASVLDLRKQSAFAVR